MGLTASPSSGGTCKCRRSSRIIRSRKSTQRGMASRRVGQLPTDDEDEEEEDEDDEDDSNNKEGEDNENDNDVEEAVKKDVETGINSDT